MKWETQGGMPTLGLTISKIADLTRQLQEEYALAGHLAADEDKTFSWWCIKASELKKLELNMVLTWNKRRAS